MISMENYEKLKTLESREDLKILVEKLNKNKIQAKERAVSEAGPYEVWVSANDLFAALGVAAEFDLEIKKKNDSKKVEAVKKKEKKTQKSSSHIKMLLGLLGVVLIFYIGYQFNKAFSGLSSISKDIKPISINVNTETLKADYKSLIENSKNIHSKKKKWNFKSVIFKWNLSKAEKAYNIKDFKTAMIKLEKCIKLEPENYAIITLLTKIYHELNLLDKAKVLLMNCYDLPAADYKWKRWVALQLADVYLKEEGYFGAEYELIKILEIKPEDIIVLKKLAQVKSLSGDISQAIEYVKKVLAISEDEEIKSQIFLGKLLTKIKMYDEANNRLKKIYEVLDTPDTLEKASLILADVNINLGNFSKADEYLNVIKITRDDTEEYRYLKAEHSYLTGNHLLAKENFDKIIENNQDFTIAELYLNLVRLHNNKLSEAEDFIDKMYDKCARDDEKALLYYNIACIELKKDNYKKSWDNLMISYKYDKYLFKKFINDSLIQKFKKSSSYSARLKKL